MSDDRGLESSLPTEDMIRRWLLENAEGGRLPESVQCDIFTWNQLMEDRGRFQAIVLGPEEVFPAVVQLCYYGVPFTMRVDLPRGWIRLFPPKWGSRKPRDYARSESGEWTERSNVAGPGIPPDDVQLLEWIGEHCSGNLVPSCILSGRAIWARIVKDHPSGALQVDPVDGSMGTYFYGHLWKVDNSMTDCTIKIVGPEIEGQEPTVTMYAVNQYGKWSRVA